MSGLAARVLAVKRSSGPTSAAGLRGALSALFSWGMEMGLVHENPVVGSLKIERQPSRDRVLSGDELAAIWNALGDDNFGTIVKLLILTGCRREEIGGMRWSEFDLDNNIGTCETSTMSAVRSAFGGKSENNCSLRNLPVLTRISRRFKKCAHKCASQR
jgi:integrase